MGATTPSPTIVLYDIDMRPPCAPNPWKARYALNFKGVSYSTTWVDMPDITKIRCDLGVPASRKFADGTDYHTLPVMTNSKYDSKIGDSFDIAVFLQSVYPKTGAGNLFPQQTLDYVYAKDLAMFAPLSELNGKEHAEYARFNMNVDAAFSAHVLLMVHGLPFNPDTTEKTRAEFVRRSGVASWDNLTVRGEQREELKVSLHDTLGGLAKLFRKDNTGPFLLGEQANYADIIVGAWLRMMHGTLPAHEWEEAKTWHEGVFGKLHDALEKYALVN
ncbi:hypothetical protein N7509_009287 [Penicillium cosmopolitanum]|uniref:GST N-terminal domain-containing protein n=1 Tax=Penicillium cosmopolitanum TaxID=1131564 RepID=A0A9W9VP50_9EURO|nr:uncharacterized protein N7509_009287 [Penicillium cosmopolitanum]KAJ5386746.1 hypothetical protein N7509_009287 [Penicillium cosmopolitanum]